MLSTSCEGKIVTDNERVWDSEATEFNNMLEEVGGCEVEWGDPQDHARDNARAEGMNKIIEADQDQPAPITQLFHGYISPNQVGDKYRSERQGHEVDVSLHPQSV